jgi:hypothetical protein
MVILLSLGKYSGSYFQLNLIINVGKLLFCCCFLELKLKTRASEHLFCRRKALSSNPKPTIKQNKNQGLFTKYDLSLSSVSLPPAENHTL